MLWHQAAASLELPSGKSGTLILTDASGLDRDSQRRLQTWIGAGIQIITTAERPLFLLVATGLFDAGLYYRLNTLLLRLGTEPTTGPHSQVVHQEAV